MEIPIAHKPTAEDMRRLASCEYYVWDGKLYLRTYRAGLQVYFVCPFCVTRYRKNGAPYANAKPCVHYHGAGGFDTDGFGNRSSHCNRLPDAFGGYHIFCDDLRYERVVSSITSSINEDEEPIYGWAFGNNL